MTDIILNVLGFINLWLILYYFVFIKIAEFGSVFVILSRLSSNRLPIGLKSIVGLSIKLNHFQDLIPAEL